MYKAASHFFQRFKESTGKNAFSLWLPVREHRISNQKLREAPSTGTMYSAGLRRLFCEVASCQHRIIIVHPYIKLSLVRPFLLALPRRKIELQVFTKFDVNHFRFSSDLRALELLLRRPAVPGHTRLFGMSAWHEPVFIIDDKTVVSLPRRNSSSRASQVRKDGSLAGRILSKLKSELAERSQLTMSDVDEMRARVFNEPSAFLDQAVYHESNIIRLNAESFVELDESSEITFEESLDEVAFRDVEIQEFVDALQAQNNNTIEGRPFETLSLSREDSLLLNAARRDVERIRNFSRARLGLRGRELDLDAIVAPFVHQSWISWVNGEISHGLQGQFFSQLGKQIIHLEVALYFTSQVAHDAATAGPASVATHGTIPFLDYLTPLESNGLNILLTQQQSSLGKQYARDQFEAVVGLLDLYGGHQLARDFVLKSLQDDLESQQVMESPTDFKTLLQNFAQLGKQSPQYTTVRVGGEDHEALFSSSVKIANRTFDEATGCRKREAEVNAAKNAISELISEPHNLEKYRRALTSTLGSAKIQINKYSLSIKRANDCESIARQLGFGKLNQLHLMDLALTHTSWVHEHPETRSYLRLAFLGSYVTDILLLEDCIREYGWRVPGAGKENYLTIRHRLASILATVFDHFNFGTYVRVASNVRTIPASVKTDVIQSILAVAFLEKDMSAARSVWDNLVRPTISNEGENANNCDGITILQEITQANHWSTEYIVERDPRSPSHQQEFRAICRVNGVFLGTGRGPSKKDAKQMAARQALSKIPHPTKSS